MYIQTDIIHIHTYTCRYIQIHTNITVIVMPPVDYAPGHNYALGGCSIYTWLTIMYMLVYACICMYWSVSCYMSKYILVYVCIWSYHTVYACIVLTNMLEKTEWALSNDGMPASFLAYHNFAGAAIPSRYPTWNEL